MAYDKCRDCKYRCTCCSSREGWSHCSGCESHYDEFKPAENIIYCPMTGQKIVSHPAIRCKHMKDNSICSQKATNSGHCKYPCSYYERINDV